MRWHFLFVLVASLVANGALAQSSVAPASLYGAADVIFTARLARLSISPSGSVARFEVSEFIKGTARKQKYLRAQVSIQGDCHAFEENHRYLIYGRRIGDQLWINPCDGSKLISLAEPDLKYIHSVNPKVSEQCNQSRLAKIARSTRIVVTAEVVATEDTMGSPTFFRPWCGLAFTTEDAYYRVTEVLKGEVSDPNIAVEHVICWNTITVGGYSPALSPELFKKGNVLLLFLNPGSHQPDRRRPLQFLSVYEDTDENCGAVIADEEAALSIAQSIRTEPQKYKRGWLDENVDCLIGADGKAACTVSKN